MSAGEKARPVGPTGVCVCHQPDYWCDLHGPAFARGQGTADPLPTLPKPCNLARVEHNGDQFCYEHRGAAHAGDPVRICDEHPNYERYNR